MDTFFKAIALAVVCVMLYLILSKSNKDIATALSVIACAALMAAAAGYLDTVMDFLGKLIATAKLDGASVEILLKATGIGILAEFCVTICTDAGNASLGKGIQILSAAMILWLSLPLFTKVIELITSLLENV